LTRKRSRRYTRKQTMRPTSLCLPEWCRILGFRFVSTFCVLFEDIR
jgi:hypothetical protein